jgi:Replication-relaxation
MTPCLPPTTPRDRDLLDRLAQHEPLSTSELCLLFFTNARVCRRRLVKLETHDLLTRVYPARTKRGGRSEALWFLSTNGRRTIGAPARRPPGLSIPDLEHRRDVARFFLALIQRSLTRHDEGLYTWLGEQQAQQQGTGPMVRPDGYGRYLLTSGEIAFYVELDRGTEHAGRLKTKLDAYHQALATDAHRDQGNILLVCDGRRRLANLARCAPSGPPWVWGTTDHETYTLLPGREQQRPFRELPAGPRDAHRHAADCLGRRWRRQPTPTGRRGHERRRSHQPGESPTTKEEQ